MAAKYPADNNFASNVNHRYLMSVKDEPKQELKPIAGYENVSLMSLEEAVKPVVDLLDDELAQNIRIAKRNSRNPADNLSSDEAAAIHLYTMEWEQSGHSLYSQLNRSLRIPDRRKLQPWFPFLKLFITALWKLPSTKQVLWRGVKEDLSRNFEVGEEYTWWAISSCTRALNVLESPQYLGNSGTRTLFNIECYNGKMIRQHSYFQEEDEILLLPGFYFVVLGNLSPAPGLHIIQLQEKQPPHCLLAPLFVKLLEPILPEPKEGKTKQAIPSNRWSTAGNMSSARSCHSATLLSCGKVLVTGGDDSSNRLSSCELYDPTSNRWSTAGNMSSGRYKHSATLLSCGKVLVTGGSYEYPKSLSSCELYDPTSNRWSTAGNMSSARAAQTATLLSCGKVLVTGGYDSSHSLSSCELYDPTSNRWSTAGNMSSARSCHSATLLSCGKVLVTGGYDSSHSLSSCELYE
ncbi:unnamed protein product [Didymodactylos carnosus]|uniref:NAD(P)(+)--arginine ADP-ribosyltransferase n=1 Tax=Didymodactylos carnosus TaxID=1234261 RepID=A0A815HK50_9BILA|nr:unnamed protein product [Didymodactylos carnosus]CAF4228337.1 unnamed protein product [Didymodactylos carnosus]